MTIDHDYTREVVCPHCGYEHHDSWELGDSGEMDCEKCERPFRYQRDVEVTYSTEQITKEETQEGHKP